MASPAPPALTAGQARRAAFTSTLESPSTTSASSSSSAVPIRPPSSAGPKNNQQQNKPKSKPKRPPGIKHASSSGLPRLDAAGKVVATEIEDESNVCFLCAEPVTLWAVGECNHRTCHTCSVRMRALFKSTHCPFCKTDCARVVFTPSRTAPYADFPLSTTPFWDARLGLYFLSQADYDLCLSLLVFNCPRPSCSQILTSWQTLKQHTSSVHHETMCDLCVSHKKVFSAEHELFGPGMGPLRDHEKKQHAKCGFCRIWFYDWEELHRHCRDRHESCFLCRDAGMPASDNVHLGYAQLETHFRVAHHLCPSPVCLERKFVVFASELDLQAHIVQEHGATMLAGQDQRSRKDARRVETHFTYGAAPHMPSGPSGPGTGRGAGGRQVPGASGSRGASNQPSRSATPVAGTSSSANASTSNGVSPENAAKHTFLLKRVSEIVRGSEVKLQSFRNSVKSYRASELPASGLVDQLWNVFEQDLENMDVVMRGVVDVLDDPEKSADLEKEYGGFRSRKTNFPSLGSTAAPPRPNNAPKPSWTANQAPGRAKANQNGRLPNSYPALPSLPRATSQPSAPRKTTNAPSATPWLTGASTTPSSSSVSPAITPRSVTPAPSSAGPSRAVVRPGEFPSLPSSQAEAERKARINAVLGRGTNGAGGSSSGTSGWGVRPEEEAVGGEEEGGGRRKKGKGKVLLLSHGAVRG